MTGGDDERPARSAEEQAAGGSDENRFTTWLLRLEVWMVVLISLSSVAIAWSAYQAHRWSGIQAENRSSDARTGASAPVPASGRPERHRTVWRR